MHWTADTLQGQINVGMTLTIQPVHGAGLPLASLSGGDTIAVRFSTTSASVSVVEVTKAEVIIQLTNGSRWRMARREEKEVPLAAPPFGNAPAEYWMITGLVSPAT